MVAAGVLAFRKGREAALILGIVLGVLRRVRRADQSGSSGWEQAWPGWRA
jgi:high-affinity Fe2+/Pb2+ permease